MSDEHGDNTRGGPVERLAQACRDTGIRRPADGRWVGGVAAGIAVRYDVDPVVVRVGFILVGFLGGLALPLYLFGWLLLPAHDERVGLEEALRRGDPRSIVLGVLALLSLVTLGSGRHESGIAGFVGLLLVAGVGWALVRPGRRSTSSRSATAPTAASSPGTVDAAPVAVETTGPGGVAATAAPTPASVIAPRAAPAPLYRPAPPPAPPVPSPVRRVDPDRRVRRLVTLLTLGIGIVAYQATVLIARAAGAPVDHHILGLCVVLGLVGLVLVGVGLAGHRARLVSAAAWVLGILLFLSTLPGAHVDGMSVRSTPDVGDIRWAPASVAELQDSYSSQVGSSVLDLSALDAATLSERRISVTQGLGELRVVLPAGVDARVSPQIGLGQWCVERPQEPAACRSTGEGSEPVTLGSGTPRLLVDAHVGAGELTISQEDAR